jgi:hypothetical protein
MDDIDIGDLTITIDYKWSTPNRLWMLFSTQDQKKHVCTDMGMDEAKRFAEFILDHIAPDNLG